MNMTQLLHFQAIYKYQNLTHAAESLYITQQGLSRSIRGLEEELDVTLFVRTSKGVIPTAFADAIIGQTDEIVELYHSMTDKLSYLRKLGENTIVVDSYRMILDYFPHGTQYKVEKELFPNLRFIYHELDEKTAMENLLAEKADLSHISSPVDTSLFEVFPLKTFPVMALVRKENPLSQMESLALEDIAEENIISFSSNYNIYHHFLLQCSKKGIKPHISYHVADALHMYSLCVENEGIGICPAFYCDYLPQNEISIIPLAPGELQWTISVTVKKGRKHSEFLLPYVKAFEEFARQ